VRKMRAAAAEGGGDSGMGSLDGEPRPVLVVVTGGRFAMTVARTDSGDTPRVAVVQPVTTKSDAAATAPTRAGEGEIMPAAGAE